VSVLVVSYSRADQALVRTIVSLVKAVNSDLERAAYWDEDFEPGKPWFEQLKAYIDAAPKLFVFWCGHAAESAQVRREFLYAFEQRKTVIPVLLDDTDLPAELAPLHGIDLRPAVAHGIVWSPPRLSRDAGLSTIPTTIESGLGTPTFRAEVTDHEFVVREFARHLSGAAFGLNQ
jgi:hypothetical protein